MPKPKNFYGSISSFRLYPNIINRVNSNWIINYDLKGVGNEKTDSD
jgi:hypothetical protein